MRHGQAMISAVLSTLVRATVDARSTVVLRTRRAEHAIELARWLEQAHGSRRVVIPSTTQRGDIVVRLPTHVVLPQLPGAAVATPAPLATLRPGPHLSGRVSSLPPTGSR